MPGRIVICGGSGFIGTALSQHLLSAGYEVALVGRHPKPGEFGWAQLPEVLEGSLAVVNLAGRSIACKFSNENKKEILSSRLESARMVAEAIAKCSSKPRKWINASATGFYGDRGDEVLDETSEAGSTFSAETCVLWEKACLESAAETEKIALRIGVVLSAHGGVLSKLIPLVKAFLGGTASSGKQWISWIHLLDAVRMIQWVIEHDTPQIVSVSTRNPVQNDFFMKWLRTDYGRPWSPPVPAFALILVGKIIGPDASLVLDSYRVVPTSLPEFKFEYPTLVEIGKESL